MCTQWGGGIKGLFQVHGETNKERSVVSFPRERKEIEHYGINSPLHPHVSSLILSICDQTQHCLFLFCVQVSIQY